MTIRNMVMVAGLAAVASGCVVAPGHYEGRRVETSHRVVYHENDSYEGYYYARVVYISGVPWYVDEYRRARPIPRHLHAHFRHSSWARSLPPRFSQDTVVRDGYPLSRIVYVNDTPHHIDDDRRARPLPTRLRSRFSYVTVVHDNDRGRKAGERPESPVPMRERERERDERPAYVRERERQELPAHVRVREEPPAYGRGPEREEPPAYERMRERERDGQPAFGRGREREETPAHVRMRERDERPVQVREQVRHEQPNGREREAVQRRGDSPEQAVMQERVRDERGQPAVQGRGRSDDERIGRDRAPGVEQGRGRIQAVSDGHPSQRGAAKGNDPRTEEKRKGKGRGKDGDDDEGEEEADRKQRGRP
jgi:hypothetical protein